MIRSSVLLLGLVLAVPARAAEPVFVFRDVGESAGLFPALAGIRGHAAAWGDVDGDGWPDLFVGTFHTPDTPTSRLLRNVQGKFRLDPQPALRLASCASGAVFADLDNDGDLDLYVSNNANGKTGSRAAPSALFRNDSGGRFTDVSHGSGACPAGFLGRSVAAADFDGDGLLDLLACDFYYTPRAQRGVALYRNRGDFHFEDVAAAAGLPTGQAVAGCAVADVNGDGRPDVFLVRPDGDNRLYLNDGTGKFSEAAGTRTVFRWKGLSADDPPTGVCIADVNRDGLPDVVIGHHFKMPWRKPAPVRLYLQRPSTGGNPIFEDVTEAAGLTPLAMKAPHVEIQDFDNDGWPDLFVSIVKFRDGRPHPVLYRNQGVRAGLPRFRDDAWGVNDYPTAADREARRTGPFFERMLREKKIIYSAAAPSGDFDRDGRVDLFLTTWWGEARSLLLRNETPGGHWLNVRVEGPRGVNRMGIGSRVRLYRAGKLRDIAALLGDREISVGYGWCSGQEAVAHFGLGDQQTVDLEITLPHGKGKITRRGVRADQRLMVRP